MNAPIFAGGGVISGGNGLARRPAPEECPSKIQAGEVYPQGTEREDQINGLRQSKFVVSNWGTEQNSLTGGPVLAAWKQHRHRNFRSCFEPTCATAASSS